MVVFCYDGKRSDLIDMLPRGWADKMAIPGAVPMTVWPDAAIVYSGTDEEAFEVLKRYGLDSDEVRAFFSKSQGINNM